MERNPPKKQTSPAQEGHGPAAVRPEEAIKVIKGMEHLSQGKADRIGIVLPGEGKNIRVTSLQPSSI